jgi:hypothetical protein
MRRGTDDMMLEALDGCRVCGLDDGVDGSATWGWGMGIGYGGIERGSST